MTVTESPRQRLRRPDRRATLGLPGRPSSVTTARALVDEVLEGGPFLSAARLVMSELATNAVRWGGGRVRVEVRAGATVRIGVWDPGRGEPVIEDTHLLADRGRGMAIVEALSLRWWVERDRDGKTVWSEIGPPPGA